MTQIHAHRAAFLLSAVSSQITGSAIDTRGCADYGFLWYQASGESGIFDVQASHNLTAWHTINTWTATATQTGTAQLVGFYPYMRAQAVKIYTATGAGGTATGVLWAHFTPGIE